MSPRDELRYWRNLAMQRGHESLDPDYIENAIRDIYEHDLLPGDGDIRQTRRSRTPHPPHAHPPHIPHAGTSHGTYGNEAYPRAPTQTRTQSRRPVTSPEEVLTPVTPSSTTRDQLPHNTRTRYSSSGIESNSLQQPPYHRSPPPYQEQPHNSHTPTYHRTTEFDPYPSHGPHHSFPPFLNEGIQINPEPTLLIHYIQWSPPFARDTSETWRTLQRSPATTPGLYAFRFPLRPLPRLDVPADTFWAGDTVSGQEPASAQQGAVPPVQQPPDTYTEARLWSGWLLSSPSSWRPTWAPAVTPGSGRVPHWNPGTWPPVPRATEVPIQLSPWLAPNPIDPNVPQIEWDLGTHPATARWFTGAHVILPLDSSGGGSMSAGIGQEPATSPASDKLFVLCDVSSINRFWGPIVIERPGGRVTIGDLLEGIYIFFQMHLSRAEVAYISSLGPEYYRLPLAAYQRRVAQRPSGVPRDRDGRDGIRRVDCLGDGRRWWGAWVTHNPNGTWQLNLGLSLNRDSIRVTRPSRT